mmetsp:Transcript_37353/g.62188  ORF Transcript_37353/g.62188 Transcript_37353/m.62188 type:complete len:85 (+) Transcript_37353:520-774(+)
MDGLLLCQTQKTGRRKGNVGCFCVHVMFVQLVFCSCACVIVYLDVCVCVCFLKAMSLAAQTLEDLRDVDVDGLHSLNETQWQCQ